MRAARGREGYRAHTHLSLCSGMGSWMERALRRWKVLSLCRRYSLMFYSTILAAWAGRVTTHSYGGSTSAQRLGAEGSDTRGR